MENMATIIEINKAFAQKNIQSAHEALLESCKSFIGSEAAYAAATGCDYINVPFSHIVHAQSHITWQAEHEEAMSSITEAEGDICEILKTSFDAFIAWIIDTMGAKTISIENQGKVCRISSEDESYDSSSLEYDDKSIMKLEW
jgi:hypothetical protein